jgi:hypothetical protein
MSGDRLDVIQLKKSEDRLGWKDSVYPEGLYAFIGGEIWNDPWTMEDALAPMAPSTPADLRGYSWDRARMTSWNSTDIVGGKTIHFFIPQIGQDETRDFTLVVNGAKRIMQWQRKCVLFIQKRKETNRQMQLAIMMGTHERLKLGDGKIVFPMLGDLPSDTLTILVNQWWLAPLGRKTGT